jgi:hypothetical protein
MWGWYNMFSSCCDKDSAFIFTTACLTSTLLETGVDANDCKCSRDQQLNVPSEARHLVADKVTKFFETVYNVHTSYH